MLLLMESIVLCFLLLLICVIGIANGPAGLVVLYENDVQERAVELGYTTRENMKKSRLFVSLALFVPFLTITPLMVYGFNGADGFFSGFLQMTFLLLSVGLFDRLFIDWYWVNKTKAWLIPGTEDLRPYIPKKVLIRKWLGTLVGFPVIAACLAGIVQLVFL